MSKNNPLKEFGKILQSNEIEIPFKGGEITIPSEDVRKDIVYDNGGPITHYWSYYFINDCEDGSTELDRLIGLYCDLYNLTLSDDDFDKILMGKDDQFYKFYERIEPLLHPLYRSPSNKGFGEWVTEISV